MIRLIRTAGVFLAVAALTGTAAEIASFAQAPAQPAGPGPVFPQAMPDCLAFGEARTATHSRTGTLRFIGTDPGRPILNPRRGIATPESAALAYLSACGTLFGLRDAATELTVTRNTPIDGVRRAVRLQQRHQGIPVLGGELIVHLDNNNDVLSVAGETVPSMALSTSPAIDAAAAARTARDLVASTYSIQPSALSTSAPELWVYAPSLISPRPARPSLVWRLEVVHQQVPPVREQVLVDAQQGTVALNFNQIETLRNRQTYNLGNTTTLPGTLVCNEANPTCSGGDADAVAAHQYAGDTYNFYFSNFGRDSLNNAGMTLTSSVHYGPVGYRNAFWNGQQMAYGDGFSLADDVVGHELTHGVTSYTSGLLYYYQSGAINESFSDVFGEFIDLGNGSGTDTAGVRWLLGEDVPGGGAIRNMQNPPAFGNPDKMTSPYYYTGSGDNGGVHYNSGINNKAAYLMVDGGTFNGQTIAGLGIPKTARIYYEVETAFLTSGSDYGDLHEGLFQACTNLIGTLGITSNDCQQVRNATLAVEMNLQPVPNFNQDAPLCSPGQLPVTVFFDSLETGLANFSMTTSVGSNRWTWLSSYAHSGRYSLYGNDQPQAIGDSSAALASVMVPAGAYLHFAHAFGLETPDRDGGVVEYSTNGGASWNDAGPLMDAGGYRGPIAAGLGNPLAGRPAFIGVSHGYVSTRVNLASLAGQNVRFRWRLGIDAAGYGELGWVVDDVRLYQCSGASVTSVVPNSAAQGRVNLSVAVTGQDTHFVQGSTAGSFGAGITVNSVTVADATHLTATITIASGAALGARDVSFTTASELAVKLNAFAVTQGPQLASITPNRGQPGQTNLAVAIAGVATNFVPSQTSANFGAGITTVSTTVTDATHATAVITIGSGTAAGARNVTLTTGSEVVTAVSGFLVRVLPAESPVYAYVLGRRLSPSQGGTNGIQTVNVINTATNGIVATIPAGQGCSCVGPDGLAVHPDGTRVYVANEMENTISIIDTLTNTNIGTVPVGSGPIAVTVHPNGSRVYVVNGSSPTSVQVLDTVSHATLATIPLDVVQARGVTISPDGSRLYVTTYGSGSIKAINTATNTVIATVTTGNVTLGLDTTPDGSKLYVVAYATNGSGNPHRVAVINTATNTMVGNVAGVPAWPTDVSVAPDGTRAFVIQTGTLVTPTDPGVPGSAAIVSTATDTVTGTIPSGSGYAAEFTPDGSRVYVTWGSVKVLNAQTNTDAGFIPFTDAANGFALSVAMGPGPQRTMSLSGDLRFGNRWVDSTSYGTLVVSNAGNSPLTVNSITFPPGFDGAWAGGASIAGGMVIPAASSRTVSVSFTPRGTQPYGGQIVVNANQTSGAVTYAVSGTGITFPLPAADFDHDGKADIGIYRRTTGLWAIIQSGGGSKVVGWGDPGSLDVPVPADYDGDGKADIAVYRKTTGEWFIIRSSTGTLLSVGWGHPPSGDVPVPADYDGDGKADIAVYRTSTAQWFIIRSSNLTLMQVGWGSPSLGDVPVPADYDGDGKADIAVHRLSTGDWFIIRSSNGTLWQVGWGAPSLGDIPVVGDYDGDGKADVAVYRLSTGGWYVIKSSTGTLLSVNWGAPSLGDIPVPGDYDGDGKIDVAVYRTTTGEWFIIRSTNSTLLQVGWGSPGLGDMPPQYK